jgi:hypothetical protein
MRHPAPYAYLLLALATLAPATAAQAAKGSDDPSFRLINRGTRALTELYATPAGRETWGRNRLDNATLPPSATRLIRIPRTGDCIFDLRVVFADHKALEKKHTDLCRITDLAVP